MNPQNMRLTPDQLETMLEMINSQDHQGLKALNEAFMNALMLKEREMFLRNNGSNKANGFYSRTLASGLGKIELTIPRDRLSEFRPYLLPTQWKRGEQTYEDLMASLVMHGYSPNKIKAILKQLNLPYTESDLEELKETIYQKSVDFKTRELNESALCLYIDAYHTTLKDSEQKKVHKAAIHTVIGVDLDGKKEVYGFYEYFGSETKEHWLMILNDLISRGLKKPLLIVSDDFPGLAAAIATLYPKADHQLCMIHLKRNVRQQLGKNDAKDLIDTLTQLKTFKDPQKAMDTFTNACEALQKKYPTFIKCLIDKKERYFTFLKYPQGVRKFVYTTNIAENFNSRLEVLRVNLGGYFQSTKTLSVAIQVLIDNIATGKWRKAVPAVYDNQYEIHQMFRQRYGSD